MSWLVLYQKRLFPNEWVLEAIMHKIAMLGQADRPVLHHELVELS
jgi:hypothetical protein